MKRLLYCCMAALLFLAGGCLIPDRPGAKLWFYVQSNNAPPTWDTTLTRVSFLELQPDGTYTQDFGHFEYGSWTIRNEQLYLTNQHRKTYIYRMKDQKEKLLSLVVGVGLRTAYFRGLDFPSRKPEKDPFSLYNNQWRVPPAHKESDAEIRSRLYKHCRFWERYFTWELDQGSGSVDVTDIPTPLKIYGNGFGLKHYADLPAGWKACFFDDEDCHKADTLIKHTFRKHDIAWPDTDNDLKKFISGMQQLEGWLK